MREKFARKCDFTGEGMNSGYMFEDHLYIKYEENLVTMLEGVLGEFPSKEALLDAAYEEGLYFWTEWEDEDDYEWEVDENGELVEIEY